jgi:hypothetical protein
MAPMKRWSRAGALGLVLLTAGCGEGAKLVQATPTGGVVTYPFKGDNHLVSSFRSEAFQLMDKQCAGAYGIVREGEAKGRSRTAGPVQGAEEVIRERRWGIEFRCK